MRNRPVVRRAGERGLTTLLWLGLLSFVFIILPMIGLAIDVGFIYAVRARMQAAVDGASLAAARALSIGQTLSSQTTSAQNNAVTWFYANFPSNYYGIASVTMGTNNVVVATDPNNAQLMDVTVSASAQVNTFFMRMLGANTVTVGATGNASRRSVVAMIVLDRSTSMCSGDGGKTYSSPCGTTPTSLPCSSMIKAAKLFTGQFAENSDYIGLISFGEDVHIHSLPTQSFQSTLGYSNSSGSGTGELDKVVCDGGTGTAEGISMAYQAIEQMNLPGALNVIVLETDGLPNTLTMSFYDATNKVTGLSANNNTCTDTAGKTLKNGGFGSTAVLPPWAGGMSLTASPFGTYTGTGVPYSSISSYMTGSVYSDDPGNGTSFDLMLDYYVSAEPSSSNALTLASTPGCTSFGDGKTPTDLAWFPATDVFGNSLNPSYGYQTVTTDANGHVLESGGWSNYHNAVLNAVENSAYNARTNTTIPLTVLAIGLGGNSIGAPPDPVLLQRMANDPNGDEFNSPPLYTACSTESLCTTWSSQPQGTFVYSPNAANLGDAFLRISSQVLRLSK